MLGTFPQKDVVRFLVQLAETPGPSLGEGPRRELLEAFFGQRDIPTSTDAAGNLWVSLGDGVWPEAVVLDAHIDVVENGFCPRVTLENKRITGRGVADNLAAVSLISHMAAAIDPSSLRRPLRLLFSVGEEGTGNLKGIRRAVKDHPVPPHLFLAFDLGLDTYSLTGIGSSRYRVRIQTPGGHSWEDFGLPNAIEKMGLLFIRIHNGYQELLPERPPSRTLTFNMGSISGGGNINAIARDAVAEFEFRSEIPELLVRCDALVNHICNTFQETPDIDVFLESIGKRPAARAVSGSQVEQILTAAFRLADIDTQPVPRSTSINATLAAGWPSACVGLCTCGNIHRPDEYLDVSSLSRGWRLLEALLVTTKVR
ncbi:MAG: hypothetical protein CSA22_09340 [Deltaproteobacteria bacterium]|nr:MAG: hypothetical protein CSA22_09340 [Deltaproteobacteria bacterium]